MGSILLSEFKNIDAPRHVPHAVKKKTLYSRSQCFPRFSIQMQPGNIAWRIRRRAESTWGICLTSLRPNPREGKEGLGQLRDAMIKCAWQDGSTKMWKRDLYSMIVIVSIDLVVEGSRPKTKDTSVPGLSKCASVAWKVKCFEILRHVVEIPPNWKTGLAGKLSLVKLAKRYRWRTMRGFSKINKTTNGELLWVCHRQVAASCQQIMFGLEYFASNTSCLCVCHSWLTNKVVFWRKVTWCIRFF